MTTTYLMLKYCADYADEFSVHGFAIITQEQYNQKLQELYTYFEKYDELAWYFGTNEFTINYDAESVIGDYDVIELTEEEYLVYKKHNLLTYGHYGPLINVDSRYSLEV
jgi:hypothetical protein